MTELKNPVIAALMSFFVPGWGQVYNGQGILKGLLYVIGIIIGSVVLVLPGIIVYVYCIYNAYSVAKKINSGSMPVGKQVGLGTHILYIISYFVVVFGLVLIITGIMFLIMFIFSIPFFLISG